MAIGSARLVKFGTDGWRGRIADDYTFDAVRACAQGVAHYLQDVGMADRGLVIGFDTRFASEHFAAAAAEVLAGNGIKTYLCDKAAPTPAVSYGILVNRAAGAAVITASHNPWTDNGFKYKPEYAGSASPEVVEQLEQRIRRIQADDLTIRRLDLAQARRDGLVVQYEPSGPYFEQIGRLIDLQAIRDAGLVVAVDSMHGAGAGYFQYLIRGKTAVDELRAERNPYFGGLAPEPIPRNLHPLIAACRGGRYAIGLSTDGDADRLGLVDERGEFITQLQTYALLALYLLEVRGERGPLVKALTTTRMAEKLGELYRVPVHETAVGFKYIGPVMMREHALLGGEESGGYAFRGHIPERDGVLAGLYMLDFLLRTGKKASELVEYLYSKVGPHYYGRIDLHFPADQRSAILERLQESKPAQIDGGPVVGKDAVDGFRFFLDDGTWLLVRFSGTEPIMRIYTETTSPDRIDRILQEGKRLAGL